MVKFDNDEDSGDGIAREAYSLFLESLFLKTFEGKNTFIPVVQPEFSEEEYSIVGSILMHFFCQFGLFPIQVCQICMEYGIYGTYKEGNLVASFLSYIPESEKRTLSDSIFRGIFIHSDVVSVQEG